VGTAKVTGPFFVVMVTETQRWRFSREKDAPRRWATSRTASPPTL
jgi:hypothetical protein